jgi:SM-20-related protein
MTPLLSGLKFSNSVLNVTVTSDCHFTHTHAEKRIALFYLNLEWKDGWHGETLFFSKDGKEIVYASRYTPGRVIVFDGCIPHSIRPQSREGPQYRYTLATIFDNC